MSCTVEEICYLCDSVLENVERLIALCRSRQTKGVATDNALLSSDFTTRLHERVLELHRVVEPSEDAYERLLRES